MKDVIKFQESNKRNILEYMYIVYDDKLFEVIIDSSFKLDKKELFKLNIRNKYNIELYINNIDLGNIKLIERKYYYMIVNLLKKELDNEYRYIFNNHNPLLF